MSRETLNDCPICGLAPERDVHFAWCRGKRGDGHRFIKFDRDRWNQIVGDKPNPDFGLLKEKSA